MAVHTAVARNFAEASENKIHSDDVARRFGFTDERKGHQFIRLYVAYVAGGEVATQIWHTAVFRLGMP
jgi:hypothetical protein